MMNWAGMTKFLAAGALAFGMIAVSTGAGDARRGGGHGGGGHHAGGGGHHRPPGGGHHGGGGYHHRPGGGGGNYHRPGGGNCRHHCGGGNYYNNWDRPRYNAGVITGLAIGGIIYSLPRNCVSAVYGGVTYRNCNGTWLLPQYRGSTVVYVRVGRPY